MSEQTNDKIFADGLIFREEENAPDWVIGKISVKTNDFIAFLNEHQNENGWLNLSVKRSRSGKAYTELDTWKPDNVAENAKKADPLDDPGF